MRQHLFLLASLATLCATTSHALDVKPSNICPETKPGAIVALPRINVVTYLIEDAAGLNTAKLDATRAPITYDRKIAALSNPVKFCRAQSKCADGTEQRLIEIAVQIDSFLAAHAAPVGKGKLGFRITRTNGEPITTTEYLTWPEDHILARCEDRRRPDAIVSMPESTDKPLTVTQFLAVRKKPTDLVYQRSDPKFEGLDPASFDINQDYVEDKFSFNIDGVVGYTFDVTQENTKNNSPYYLMLTPFMSYKQQYVNTDDKDTEIFNIGGGLIGSLRTPIFGEWNEFQFYPKYVHSFSTDANVLSGNFSYIPSIDLPGFGSVWTTDGKTAIQFFPQVNAAYYDILDAGTDPTLAEANEFYRVGPSLGFAFIRDRFVFSLSYEYYWLFSGPLDSFGRFEVAANYALNEDKTASVQIRYVDGRDLDTLQRQQMVAIGLGYKY